MAKNARQVFVAKESFAVELDGTEVQVHRGKTRVREGHALLKGRESQFEPIDAVVEFDVEDASAAPGKKRGDA